MFNKDSIDDTDSEDENLQQSESSIIDARKKSVRQAGREWNDLSEHFTSLVLNNAGLWHARRRRYGDALAFWDQSSSFGCAKAHYNLAVCYENGRGVDADIEKVKRYC